MEARVRYVHKISPSDKDVVGPWRITDDVFRDRASALAWLRKHKISAGRVQSSRREGSSFLIFPSGSPWHAIIIEVVRSNSVARRKNGHVPVNVFLRGKHIDTIYTYSRTDTLEDIRRSLIDHDGYDPAITVKEERSSTRGATRPYPSRTNSRRKLPSLRARPSRGRSGSAARAHSKFKSQSTAEYERKLKIRLKKQKRKVRKSVGTRRRTR